MPYEHPLSSACTGSVALHIKHVPCIEAHHSKIALTLLKGIPALAAAIKHTCWLHSDAHQLEQHMSHSDIMVCFIPEITFDMIKEIHSVSAGLTLYCCHIHTNIGYSFVQCTNCWKLGHYTSHCHTSTHCGICGSRSHTCDSHHCHQCGTHRQSCRHLLRYCVNCHLTSHVSYYTVCARRIVCKEKKVSPPFSPYCCDESCHCHHPLTPVWQHQ